MREDVRHAKRHLFPGGAAYLNLFVGRGGFLDRHSNQHFYELAHLSFGDLGSTSDLGIQGSHSADRFGEVFIDADEPMVAGHLACSDR